MMNFELNHESIPYPVINENEDLSVEFGIKLHINIYRCDQKF